MAPEYMWLVSIIKGVKGFQNCLIKISEVIQYHFFSVFQILVAVCNGSSWKDAFVQIIPSRKQVGATETEPKAKDIGMEVVENNTTDNTSDMPPDELDNLPSSKTNTDEDNR